MPTTKTKLPPCPWCKTRLKVVESGQHNHHCGGCNRTFHIDPAHDRFFHRDPAVHAERQDEYRERFLQRIGGRRR